MSHRQYKQVNFCSTQLHLSSWPLVRAMSWQYHCLHLQQVVNTVPLAAQKQKSFNTFVHMHTATCQDAFVFIRSGKLWEETDNPADLHSEQDHGGAECPGLVCHTHSWEEGTCKPLKHCLETLPYLGEKSSCWVVSGRWSRAIWSFGRTETVNVQRD